MKTLSFEGSGLEYFKIWIVNIFLTIITLGIYYPWAKVRNNRYFYANSILEDRNFEYHATGKQLFIGYLIGAILFITYVFINKIFPFISLVLVLALLIAIPWLIWRSTMFNMHITSFNNVRFKFTGDLKQSYITFLGYPLLFLILSFVLLVIIVAIKSAIIGIVGGVLILLVLLYGFAYLSAKKSNYLINFTRYGKGEFKTTIEPKGYLIIALKTFFVSILTLVLSFAVIALIYYITINDFTFFQELLNSKGNTSKITGMLGTALPLIIISYILILFINFVSIAYYITKQREYVFKNTKLDERISFNSSVKFLKLTYLIMTNVLAVMFTFGLAIPWAKVRLTRYMLENTQIKAEEGFDIYFNEQYLKESAIGEEIGEAFDIDVSIPL